MAEHDNSWVFDSLVCFLHGPVWNAPLQTFIEEKSIIFDPNIKTDNTNAEHKEVHNDYKNLVDYMLGSFMEEMQITPEMFEMACLEGKHQSPNNLQAFHQRLFQQIWAANDIRIFVRMMTQRNVELQLQALDLIERQNSAEEGKLEPSEVLQPLEEPEVVSIIAEDPILEEDQDQDPPKNLDSAEIAVDNDRFQRLNLFFNKEDKSVDENEIKSRQEYLRAQRDKILDIKKMTRARQLNETIKTNNRPSSAQVAQKLLAGDEKAGPNPPESSLKLRKVLASRLRNEVVDNDEAK